MAAPAPRDPSALRRHLRSADSLPSGGAVARWERDALAGRLTEITASGGGALLTSALLLVRDAQRAGEPAAWVTCRDSCFYPPDAAEGGVRLETLTVVRVPTVADVPRAADRLARSGAFGLLVLDLAAAPSPPAARSSEPRVPAPLMSRLLGLAQRHDIAVLFLTRKAARAPSLGSLISLRAEAARVEPRFDPSRPVDPDDEREPPHGIEVRVLKDKRRPPGWRFAKSCRAPAGLR